MSQHCGPDQLLPATEKWTWHANRAVKINADDGDIAADPPITLVTALRRVAENHPERLAIVDTNEGREDVYTYKRYHDTAVHVAKAFIKLGLESSHGVGIAGVNSPQWFITYMASVFADGIFFGFHSSKSEEFKKILLDKAECNIYVAEDETKVQSIFNMWDSLPHLKAIIQYRGKPKGLPNVYSWDEIMKMNVDSYEDDLKRRISNIAPNKCCTMATTSGTTAAPKVAMYNHDNLLWTVKKYMEYCNEGKTFLPDIIVSSQTSSHMTAMIPDIYWSLMCGGGTVHIAKPDAMEGSLAMTLQEVRPTIMLAIPKIWEMLMDQCLTAETNNCKNIYCEIENYMSKNMEMKNGNGNDLQQNRAARMGLDRCRLAMVGGSAVKRELREFYASINVPLMDLYGQTECGVITTNRRSDFKQDTVGRALPGYRLKLTKYSNTDVNRILMSGRNVFMGYLKDEEQTKKSFDEEGYLDSGDLGFLDEDNFLILSGRCSEMIAKSCSEKVYPVPIEQKVLSILPCLSHCVLVGEGKPFLLLLMVFKTKFDPTTEKPCDILDDVTVEWCRSIGVDAKKLSEICNSKDPKLVTAIQEAIDKTNACAAMDFQHITKWRILPEGLSVKDGELSVTMKVKRTKVIEKYRKIIDEL